MSDQNKHTTPDTPGEDIDDVMANALGHLEQAVVNREEGYAQTLAEAKSNLEEARRDPMMLYLGSKRLMELAAPLLGDGDRNITEYYLNQIQRASFIRRELAPGVIHGFWRNVLAIIEDAAPTSRLEVELLVQLIVQQEGVLSMRGRAMRSNSYKEQDFYFKQSQLSADLMLRLQAAYDKHRAAKLRRERDLGAAQARKARRELLEGQSLARELEAHEVIDIDPAQHRPRLAAPDQCAEEPALEGSQSERAQDKGPVGADR